MTETIDLTAVTASPESVVKGWLGDFEEALTALRQAETVFGPHPDILTYEGYTWRKV